MRRWPLSHRLRVADSLRSSGRWSGSGASGSAGLQPASAYLCELLQPVADDAVYGYFELKPFNCVRSAAVFRDPSADSGGRGRDPRAAAEVRRECFDVGIGSAMSETGLARGWCGAAVWTWTVSKHFRSKFLRRWFSLRRTLFQRVNYSPSGSKWCGPFHCFPAKCR